MRIRKMNPEDAPGIVRLLGQLWPDKPLRPQVMEQVLARCLSSDAWYYACAEIDGVIVGFTSVVIRDSPWQKGLVAYGETLVVDESVRGQGVGTQLIRSGIESAESRGCRNFEIDSAFHREDAHRLYEKLGFARRGYVFSKDLGSRG